MKNRTFPSVLRSRFWNWRNYKESKRQELRRAMAVLEDFNFGCAYLPKIAYHRYCRIQSELKELRQELSVKEWGR